MRRILISLLLCITFVLLGCRSDTYAAVRTLNWHLTDTGKHLDWDGKTKYSKQFTSAVKVWNNYKKGVIRKDTLVTWQDVAISDYYEVSNTAGITSMYGTIQFNTYNMDKFTSNQKKNVCIHELGHALGLAHNTSKDIMYMYATSRVKLSTNDKKSYDYVYKYVY